MASTTTDLPAGDNVDGILLDVFFGGVEDPAPLYKAIREASPVHQSANGVIFLSRYEDARALLRDDRFGKRGGTGGALFSENDSPEKQAFREAMAERRKDAQPSMLFLNPPDHTRLRGLVSRGFTPRRVESMRESIVSLTEECLDAMAETGTGDAIDILGFLPVNVIGLLVGVPRKDWARFRELVTAGVANLEPAATLEEMKAAAAAFQELSEYFVDLVEQRRAEPQDDLISALLEVEDNGDTLATGELISTATLLFSAGMETTQNLIGNGLGALFKNPDQLELLWSDPSLVPSAVDEMLRWDSPVQLDGRTALEDASFADIPVPENHSVMTLLGAANRDPLHFTDPDRFDITRSEGPPMSFGSGIHYCLGANLAKAEGQEIFNGLIRRFSKIELAGELRQRGRLTLKGYASVPMTVTPR